MPDSGPDHWRPDPALPLAGVAAPAPPAPIALCRVGVEYLPPEQPGLDLPLPLVDSPGAFPQRPQRLDPLAGPGELEPMGRALPNEALLARWHLPRFGGMRSSGDFRNADTAEHRDNSAELVERLDLSREHIATVENAAERMSLRFLREILGHDRRRVQRSLGSTVMTGQFGYLSPNVPVTHVDQRDQEDQLQRLQRYGTRLLRRPARRALKELSIVNKVQKAVDEFKAVHIPLTGAYQKRHSKSNRGRFSMHLGRGSEVADPVEIYYLRSGWKIGSGPDNARINYGKYLTDNLYVRLRSSYRYEDQNITLLGSLAYEISPQTTVNLMAGNDMYLLASPVTYLGTPPHQERSQAVAFYVEHMF